MGIKLDRTIGLEKAQSVAAALECSFVMLGHGRFALIDRQDFQEVSQLLWRFTAGYVAAHVAKKTIYLQRFLIRDVPEGMEIDHVNRLTTDNRRCNLRVCEKWQNRVNCIKRSHNASPYKGVRQDTRNGPGRYHARIRHMGKESYLGVYDTAEIAARVYNEKAKELFGEFAVFNQIPHQLTQKHEA